MKRNIFTSSLVALLVLASCTFFPSSSQPPISPSETIPDPAAVLLAKSGFGIIIDAIYSTDGKFILTAYEPGLAVFRVEDMSMVVFFDLPEAPLSIALFNGDQEIAVGTSSGIIHFAKFDPSSGEVNASDRPPLDILSGMNNVQMSGGHYVEIFQIAGSPDGKYIAVSTAEDSQVWNLETGMYLRGGRGESSGIKRAMPVFGSGFRNGTHDLSFSADSAYLLFSRTLENQNGTSFLVELGQSYAPTIWGQNADAHLVGEGKFAYWNLEGEMMNTHYFISKFADPINPIEIPLPVNHAILTFSPDGNLVSYIDWNFKKTILLRTETGMEIRSDDLLGTQTDYQSSYLSNAGWVTKILIRSDKVKHQTYLEPLVTNLLDPDPKQYTLDPIENMVQPFGDPTPVFSKDGFSFLLYFLQDTKLIHAHMPTQKLFIHQDEIASGVTSLAFSPDGKNLAVGQKDQTLSIFDVAQGLKHISSENLTTSYAQQRWFSGVTALTYSSDGNQLLATTAQGSLISMPQNGTGKKIEVTPKELGVEMYGLAISPDGSTQATGGYENALRLWQNFQTGNPVYRLLEDNSAVTSIAIAPNSSLVAAGTEKGVIRLWRPDGALERTLKGHTDKVVGAVFTPNSEHLVSASNDGTVRFWQVSDGAEIKSLELGDWVVSMALDGRGKILAIGTWHGKIYFWDMQKEQWLGMLQAGTNLPRALAFSPDGAKLAIGLEVRQIQLWQIRDESGKMLLLPNGEPQVEKPTLGGCHLDGGDSIFASGSDTSTREGNTFVASAPVRLKWDAGFYGDCSMLDAANISKIVNLPEIATDFTIEKVSLGETIVGERAFKLVVTADVIMPAEPGTYEYTWSLTDSKNVVTLSASLNVTEKPAGINLPAPLYFVSESNALMRLEKDENTQALIVESPVQCMDISPVSGEIIYLSEDALMLSDANGGNRRMVLPIGGCPSWSPDGTKIAFILNGVKVLDLKTGIIQTLREDLNTGDKNRRVYDKIFDWSLYSNRFIASVGGWESYGLIVFDVPSNTRFGIEVGMNVPSWSRNGENIYTGEYYYNCYMGEPPFVARTNVATSSFEPLLGYSDADMRGGFAPFETANGQLLFFGSSYTENPCENEQTDPPVVAAQMSPNTPGDVTYDPSPHPFENPSNVLWWLDGTAAVITNNRGEVFMTFPFTPLSNYYLPIRGSNLRWSK